MERLLMTEDMILSVLDKRINEFVRCKQIETERDEYREKLALVCALTWEYDMGKYHNVKQLSAARVEMLMRITSHDEIYDHASPYIDPVRRARNGNCMPNLERIREAIEQLENKKEKQG
jgi:hypothetical protein